MTGYFNHSALNAFDKKVSQLADNFDSKYDAEVVFYLTRGCNLACPGCYMNKGKVCKAKDFIPADDVHYYINEFSNLDNYNEAAVFSGGEIFTTPVKYLEHTIQGALDYQIRAHLKTNGQWITDKNKSDEILQMLSGLRAPLLMDAEDPLVNEYFSRYSPEYIKSHWSKILETLRREHLVRNSLDLCVSVDDKIHPAQSAKWFTNIAEKISSNSKLSRKIALKSFSFTDSYEFFMRGVIRNSHVSNVDFNYDTQICSFSFNDMPIYSWFGDFINITPTCDPNDIGDIALPSDSGRARLVFFFYPDGTAGFETMGYKSVGRVPYKTRGGEYKDFNRLFSDMRRALVNDYSRAISR